MGSGRPREREQGTDGGSEQPGREQQPGPEQQTAVEWDLHPKASPSDDRLTALSKEMAQHLRHDPPAGMDGCGFVPVDNLAEKMEQPAEPEELVEVAEQDDKGRYQLAQSDGGELRVRATQGHSIRLPNPLHEPVQAAEEVPLVLHATSEDSWARIQASGELRRMGRTHIHFASQPKHLRADEWACVLLKVDLEAAIRDGISFCKAANGVVLAEGPIPLRYVRRARLADLPPEWSQAIPNRERLLQDEADREAAGKASAGRCKVEAPCGASEPELVSEA